MASLNELRTVAEKLAAAQRELVTLREHRNKLIVALLDDEEQSHTTDEVAQAAGLAQPRVVQIRKEVVARDALKLRRRN